MKSKFNPENATALELIRPAYPGRHSNRIEMRNKKTITINKKVMEASIKVIEKIRDKRTSIVSLQSLLNSFGFIIDLLCPKCKVSLKIKYTRGIAKCPECNKRWIFKGDKIVKKSSSKSGSVRRDIERLISKHDKAKKVKKKRVA